MTDDALRDLVHKHDNSIAQLAISIEHLVQSNASMIPEIRNITRYLTEQEAISDRIDNMNREIIESFARLYKRLDSIESDSGPKSVQLIKKDVDHITTQLGKAQDDIIRYRDRLETVEKNSVSPTMRNWLLGMVIMYSIVFGTYVVQSLNTLANTDARVLTIIEELRNVR
jgi:hypothetical protein